MRPATVLPNSLRGRGLATGRGEEAVVPAVSSGLSDDLAVIVDPPGFAVFGQERNGVFFR